MFPRLPQPRLADAQWFESRVPDMIEVVRFAPGPGQRPALVVSRRKVSGPLLAQLRQLADDTEQA